jgi:outer membrane protein assembly factor BamE (lipoprotein component of BamABCDE complex)
MSNVLDTNITTISRKVILKTIKVLLILSTLLAMSGCVITPRTRQHLEMMSSISYGMTKDQVLGIMGSPAKSEFSGNDEAWSYCRTEFNMDEFAHVIFKNGRVTQVRNYSRTVAQEGGFAGDCSAFIVPVLD